MVLGTTFAVLITTTKTNKMSTTKLFRAIKKEFKLNTPYVYVRPNGFRADLIIREFKNDDNFEFIIADAKSDINPEWKKDQELFTNQLETLKLYKEVLTTENIKIGVEVELIDPSFSAIWVIGKDENGWAISGSSGSKMLFEYDFKYYRIVS